MREPVIGSEPVEAFDSRLLDLSGVSLVEVMQSDYRTMGDTALGHSLLRILGDSEDPIAAFDSALTVRPI